jgi:hypothetical protein
MKIHARAIGRLSSLSLLCSIVVLASGLLTGCVTRTVRNPVIDRVGMKVDFVREVRGFTTLPRGFDHPAIVSQERMVNILNAVEVESRNDENIVIEQPAFHPEIVEETARALCEAFAEADPDQEIAVKAIRKEMKLGVFYRKYLTSFLAYMDDGYLYLILNRVDWLIPERKEKDLPEPMRDYAPMNFRVVSGDYLFYAGPQALEIAWQDPIFRAPYRLPGSSKGRLRRREVIDQSPIPKDEQDAENAGGTTLDQLSPEQLRALADLEDDRREGRITEAAYQRARRQLLRPR